MKLTLLIFPIMLIFAMFVNNASAAPKPGNFFKDLEGVGQRIRDAIISAGPAVQVVNDATKILKPTQ